jgi:hypothetical protein
MGLRPGLSLARQPGADLPQRNRHRPRAQPVLAGSGRTPPVKDIGEPCAGEPHARFDGRGWKRSSRYHASPSPNRPHHVPYPWPGHECWPDDRRPLEVRAVDHAEGTAPMGELFRDGNPKPFQWARAQVHALPGKGDRRQGEGGMQVFLIAAACLHFCSALGGSESRTTRM